MSLTAHDLGVLVAELRRPFMTNRDQLWDVRRQTRFRTAPANPPSALKIASDAHLDYKDMLPGWIITRLKSRLGVNPVRIAVSTADPEDSDQGELLERWYRGARDELDPVDAIDGGVREGQAADGVGFIELKLKPMFVPPRDDGSATYLKDIDKKRMEYGLHATAGSPDPRSMYWEENEGQLIVACKVVNVPLIDVTNQYAYEGFKIAFDPSASNDSGTKGRFTKKYFVGQEQAPGYTLAEYGKRVRLVIIADSHYIYHCMYPVPSPIMVGLDPVIDTPGSVPQLDILAKYPNVLGCPPFFMASARTTNNPDPAFRHLPLAQEILDLAPYVNTWRESRMIAGRKAVMAPTMLEPTMPDETEPTGAGGTQEEVIDWEPGFIKFRGKPHAIPSPDMADFDKFDATLTQDYKSFNQSIVTLAGSGAIAGRTPAWSIMQFNEEFNSFIEESLKNRAFAWRSALVALGTAAKDRYAMHGKVYVYGPRMYSGQNLRVGADRKLLSIPHRVEVSIPALSQGQKAALREYAALLRDEGTISQETYEEIIGIEDKVAERERRDYESLVGPLRQVGRAVGQAIGLQELREAYGPVVDVVLGALQPPPIGGGGSAGATSPQRGGMMDRLHTPGNGMSSVEQEPGERSQSAG